MPFLGTEVPSDCVSMSMCGVNVVVEEVNGDRVKCDVR